RFALDSEPPVVRPGPARIRAGPGWGEERTSVAAGARGRSGLLPMAEARARTPRSEAAMYREVLVPVDNSDPSHWAVDRAIELCSRSGGRITGNHVYAARLHDVRFR